MLGRVVRTVNTPFEPGDLRMVNNCIGRVLSLNGSDMTIVFDLLPPKLCVNDDIDIDGWKWFVYTIASDKVIFRLRGLTRAQIPFVTNAEFG